jgi:hypothetical protein
VSSDQVERDLTIDFAAGSATSDFKIVGIDLPHIVFFSDLLDCVHKTRDKTHRGPVLRIQLVTLKFCGILQHSSYFGDFKWKSRIGCGYPVRITTK